MSQLSSCLDDLSHRTRRVLVLRADHHSRAAVADRLGLTVRRVTRIERRGLRRLRRLDRTQGCSPAAAGGSTVTRQIVSGVSAVGTGSGGGAAAIGGSGSGAGAGSGSGAAGGAPSGSGGGGSSSGTGGVLGESAQRTPPIAAAPVTSTDQRWLIMVLALLLAAAGSAYAVRRELREH